MDMHTRVLCGILCGLFLTAIPHGAWAFPFGGKASQVVNCYNDAIYANVGPPRGGPFIWSPSTKTYRFGPPTHSGQYLLGLVAPPYYCVVSREPIIVWAGILMTMMGSSGESAPTYSSSGSGSGFSSGGGLSGNTGGGVVGSGGTTGGGSGGGGGTVTGVNHIMISEVYPRPDANHGGAVVNEWIELFNPTSASIDMSQWTVRTSRFSQTIPNNTTLAAGQYLILTGTTTVRALWSIPSVTPVLVANNVFAEGLTASGDIVAVRNASTVVVDQISWGSNTSAFSPSAPTPAVGHSIIRASLARDTDTAQDWVDTSTPIPGR